MTTYTINPAHSGTSDSEIAKAKRLYRKGVKSGEFMPADEVVIRFADVNYNITAEYIEPNTHTSLGSAAIN